MESRDQSNPVGGQDESPAGLKAEVSSFLRETSAYLQLRSQLFSIEAKEAGQVYRKKTFFLFTGGILLFFSYSLLLAALIGMSAALLNADSKLTFSGWIGASLIFSFIHFILGLFLFQKGRKYGAGQAFFEYTRNELQKEQEWVKQTKKS